MKTASNHLKIYGKIHYKNIGLRISAESSEAEALIDITYQT